MSSHPIKYLLLCAPFLLAGCGEGWEMIRVDNVVPYGNSRTAGTGVAYVRAKLLPPREVNAAPVEKATTTTARPAVIPEQPAETVKSAEPVFHKSQQK